MVADAVKIAETVVLAGQWNVVSGRYLPERSSVFGVPDLCWQLLEHSRGIYLMITVHHLGVSQSERVVWLCEELAIPYTLRRYDRDPITRLAPAAYKALHPMGIAPVITDGDLVLAESGAILEYVIARYGNGRLTVGADRTNFADYLFWFHFANGTMMPSEMGSIISSMLESKAGNPVMAMLKERSERGFALVESRLGDVPYFAGDEFTAADIMMLFPLSTMRAFAQRDLAALPHIRAYLKRIGERAAYQRAMTKGDPGMAPMLA
jgi:glutathione S-transferase